jgi:hypothetical protein
MLRPRLSVAYYGFIASRRRWNRGNHTICPGTSRRSVRTPVESWKPTRTTSRANFQGRASYVKGTHKESDLCALPLAIGPSCLIADQPYCAMRAVCGQRPDTVITALLIIIH